MVSSAAGGGRTFNLSLAFLKGGGKSVASAALFAGPSIGGDESIGADLFSGSIVLAAGVGTGARAGAGAGAGASSCWAAMPRSVAS